MSLQKLYQTEGGAARLLQTGASGSKSASRAYVYEVRGGYVVVLWWGSPRYTDARVLGRGGRILAEGVQATERMLGLS